MGRLIGVAGYQSAFAGMAFLAVTLFLIAALLKSRSAEQQDSEVLPASASA